MSVKSPMMDALYGPEIADKVYARLQALDPALNFETQRIAYDHFWARPGLSIKDKSLITVSSLMALRKEEQIRIHINGFLGAGGSLRELKGTLIEIAIAVNEEVALNGCNAFQEVLIQRGIASVEIDELIQNIKLVLKSFEATLSYENDDLQLRDKNLIQVSVAVAIGKQDIIKNAIKKYLADGGEIQDLKDTFIHQIVYCGFPAAMNAFSALQESH